jgi:hypothetical protein
VPVITPRAISCDLWIREREKPCESWSTFCWRSGCFICSNVLSGQGVGSVHCNLVNLLTKSRISEEGISSL